MVVSAAGVAQAVGCTCSRGAADLAGSAALPPLERRRAHARLLGSAGDLVGLLVWLAGHSLASASPMSAGSADAPVSTAR